MATKLAKIHFLATMGDTSSSKKHLGSNAILIQDYKDGTYVYGMVDVGFYNPGNSSDEHYDSKLLVNYLKSQKISTLEFVLITHFHGDHFGNLRYLLRNYAEAGITIKNVILPMNRAKAEKLKNKLNTESYENLVNYSNGKSRPEVIEDDIAFYRKNYYSGIKLYYFGVNSTADIRKVCNIGEGTFTFYNTNGESTQYKELESGATEYPNSWDGTVDKFSIVTVYEFEGRKLLIPADIYELSEKVLTERLKNDYDIIQMSHHGSPNASCQSFIDAIVPEDKECAVIQLRSDNGGEGAIKRYKALNNISGHEFVRVYGTHQNFEQEWGNAEPGNRGSIVAEIKDGAVSYYSRRLYADGTYKQKLIHATEENNIVTK